MFCFQCEKIRVNKAKQGLSGIIGMNLAAGPLCHGAEQQKGIFHGDPDSWFALRLQYFPHGKRNLWKKKKIEDVDLKHFIATASEWLMSV